MTNPRTYIPNYIEIKLIYKIINDTAAHRRVFLLNLHSAHRCEFLHSHLLVGEHCLCALLPEVLHNGEVSADQPSGQRLLSFLSNFYFIANSRTPRTL